MNVTKIILDGQVADIPSGGGSEPVDTYTREEIDQKIAEAISGIKISLPFEHSTVEKEVGTWFGKKLYAISGTTSISTTVNSSKPSIKLSDVFSASLLNAMDRIIDVYAYCMLSTGQVISSSIKTTVSNTFTNTSNASVSVDTLSNYLIVYINNTIKTSSLINIVGLNGGSSVLRGAAVYITLYYTKK